MHVCIIHTYDVHACMYVPLHVHVDAHNVLMVTEMYS
jgi:hypothetical protein